MYNQIYVNKIISACRCNGHNIDTHIPQIVHKCTPNGRLTKEKLEIAWMAHTPLLLLMITTPTAAAAATTTTTTTTCYHFYTAYLQLCT